MANIYIRCPNHGTDRGSWEYEFEGEVKEWSAKDRYLIAINDEGKREIFILSADATVHIITENVF